MTDKKLIQTVANMNKKLDDIWQVLVGDPELKRKGLIEEHGVLMEDYRYRKTEKITSKVEDMHESYSKISWLMKNSWAMIALLGFSGVSGLISIMQTILEKLK